MHVRVLEKNAYFGEISLVYDSVRSTTVTCDNYCTLGKIGLKTLYEICSQYPFFRRALINAIQLYDDNTKVFLNSVLRDIPYL
jgi:CRP-like cAMP-binding protein